MIFNDWLAFQQDKDEPHYSHFDKRTTLKKSIKYYSNPQKIQTHGFYPFIHFTMTSRKLKNHKKRGIKKREIFYSAHIDRCIYRYYSYLLNEKYNQYLEDKGISDCVIAYRTETKKSNIDYAKIAFDYITKVRNCYVMIGDFTSFFDNLRHEKLKDQVCVLLGVTRLPPDYYAVFKSLTKYSYMEQDFLLKRNSLNKKRSDLKKFYRLDQVLNSIEFHLSKSEIKVNRTGKGIPQGSSTSAVLANIYMQCADEEINNLTRTFDGVYMRYSDDFIVIIPEVDQVTYNGITDAIFKSIDKAEVSLEPNKTKIFRVNNGSITNETEQIIGHSDSNVKIDFLGFTFDGKVITIRDKTISRFYNRMYRKIRTIERSNGLSKGNNRIDNKVLYSKYSIRGSRAYYFKKAKKTVVTPSNIIEPKGNFHDYLTKAKRAFNSNFVENISKRHMYKIRKRLKKIY